ncbi:MAG TPA: LytTR family DNA-binding domain-containing protein [Lachnospiraceae bacterium]|nr:LytTR family DNA-binding domain-containing protein [Lachnospiraceae bacterium]
MPVKIAICDDSAEDVACLSTALFAYDPSFEITSYINGKILLDEFLEGNHLVDLLFLDIYMPEINGIEAAQKIRTRYKDMKIIFLSSSKDYYPQAYEVFAFNYIVKPFERKRLYTVLDRAFEELRRESSHKIGIEFKGTVHRVDCRDIQYIESQNRLLLFHLADESVLQCYGRLEELLKELPEQSFFRCHQSFIINLAYVIEMREDHFRVGKTVISISRKYSKQVKKQYYAYLFSKMGGGGPQ